jgi:hypothetical protein
LSLDKLKSIFSNTEKFVKTDLTTFDSIYDDILPKNPTPEKTFSAITPLPPTPGKQGVGGNGVIAEKVFSGVGFLGSISSYILSKVVKSVFTNFSVFENILFNLSKLNCYLLSNYTFHRCFHFSTHIINI